MLIANIVSTSKAPVTTSVALVTSSFFVSNSKLVTCLKLSTNIVSSKALCYYVRDALVSKFASTLFLLVRHRVHY